MKPISPRDELENVLRYWWFIALLAVWGGVIGWWVHSWQPPLYDAKTVISISIDFPEDSELTQFEEDHAVGVAADVIMSTPVIEQVVREANVQGIQINAPALLSKLHAERRLAQWTFIIRDEDPQTAATLANLLATHGLEALSKAHRHALMARSLQYYLASLQTCLQEPAVGRAQPSICSQKPLDEIRAEGQQVTDDLNQEYLAAQGVLPGLVFSLNQEASPPDAPARFGQNTLVFAGGMIGFIMGVLVINMRLPQRLAALRGKNP